MQIILNKTYDPIFVYYFRDYVADTLLESIDKMKLKNLDKEFKIDSYDILVLAIKNLRVYESTSDFTIKFDKNVKYEGDSISGYLEIITYGSRTCKGYPIINDIFNLLVSKIDYIYEEWLDGR